MKTIAVTFFTAFLFLLNIPIFAEESKVYTNQDLYKPTKELPAGFVLDKEPKTADGLIKSLNAESKQVSEKDIVSKGKTYDPNPVKFDDETAKPSFTFLGNEYEINVTHLNIFIGIAVGIVVVVFFIILWKKRKKNQESPRVVSRKTKVIYYSIFSVFIIAGIGALSINYFRYETDTVGRWALKYDRLEKVVYMRYAFKDEAPWRKTKLKNIAYAKYYLEQRLREEAAESAVDDIKRKLDDIQDSQEELQRQQMFGR